MRVIALCNTCNRKHGIEFDPSIGPGSAFGDWMTKHPAPDHDVDFLWPGRTRGTDQRVANLSGYIDNADVKLAYAADADYTIPLGALAESATLLAGRESTSVSNTTNLYLDYMISGHIETGTTPTVDEAIEVIAIGPEDDTPTWPDVFDGTDSAETISLQNIKDQIARYIARMTVTASTGIIYAFGPVSLASLFGGIVPTHHIIFVTHDTDVNLDATDGNHVITHIGVYATVA